jgi:hypothetical protein
VRDASDPKAVDETTDAYDTIDRLVTNVAGNNRRVGMWGGPRCSLTPVSSVVSGRFARKDRW